MANELDDIYGMRITTKNTFIHIENNAPATRRRSPSAPPCWPGCGLSHVADAGAGSIAPCLVTPTSSQPQLFDIYSDDEGASFTSGIDFGRIDLAFARLHSALQDADAYNVNVPNDDPCDLDDGQYISADVNFSCELAMFRWIIGNTIDNYAYELDEVIDDLPLAVADELVIPDFLQDFLPELKLLDKALTVDVISDCGQFEAN